MDDGTREDSVPDGEHVDDDTESGADGSNSSVEPTPQSEALRRQQRYVGIVGGALVGIAVIVSIVQRFPDLHLAIPLLAGGIGAGVVVWLVFNSIFPGASEEAAH